MPSELDKEHLASGHFSWRKSLRNSSSSTFKLWFLWVWNRKTCGFKYRWIHGEIRHAMQDSKWSGGIFPRAHGFG